MQKAFITLYAIFFISVAKSQVIKKYDINNTGCAVYMYCAPGKFDESFSEDSSKVYVVECGTDGITLGVICVKLINPINNMDDTENLLVSYLDYLKTNFNIKSAAGYGKGHRLKNREDTRGILDYWTDDEKNNWKVKGWTDGKFIGELYAHSKKDLLETKINLFLDGFRLPGM